MNQYPFFHEPSSQPLESDVEERNYLFHERVAIHQFDGHCTCAMAGVTFGFLRTVRAGDCVTEFRQRCAGLKIKGVTWHWYRHD